MPSRVPYLALSCLLLASAAFAPARDDKPARAEIARRGKAATALVEVKGRGTGTAFCVHPAGLFVTNEHIIRGAEPGSVSLVLNSGLADQRVLTAAVVRADGARDLALLRADGPGVYPALPLGSADALTELAEVVAVGFPFGRALATDEKEYPTVSVNAGSVTALRHKAGELDRVQLDVALNPGNSGGPVLDDRGRVVGVVVAGRPGTGINQAIPVTHLAALLAAPDVRLAPPELTRDALDKPAAFKARVAVLLPGAKEPDLRLVLRAGDGEAREFPMRKQGGEFVATAVPVPRSAKPARVEVTARFGSGMVAGQTEDIELTVAGKPVRLSGVRRIEFRPKPRAVLADGTTAEGEVAGLGAVEVALGGQRVKLDLSSAVRLQIQPAAEVAVVTAAVIATRDGKEVARVESPVRVRGVGEVPPADPSTVAITPPALAEDVVVKRLPEPFADVALGGGGRYLVFHLPRLKKLAVFDLSEARVTGYVPLSEDKVAFAAGLDKLVIGYPGKAALERWSLATFEREATAFPALKDPIRRVLMGHASNGPVAVNGAFFDLATLRPLPVDYGKGRESAWEAGARLYPSGDGTVFGTWNTHHSPDTATTFVLEGNEVRRYEEGGLRHVIPGPDGRWACTAKGVVSHTLKRSNPDDEKAGYCLPAVRGGYVLSLSPEQGLSVYLLGQPRPLARLDQVKHGLKFDGWDREEFGPWRRAYLVPEANLIAVLPAGDDRVVLHRFDVDAALGRSGLDYLVVTSQPPQTAKRGAVYTYPVAAKARHAPVTYRLDSGPEGMEVSKAGAVRWAVPADEAEGDREVILTVRDAAGQEVFHTFRVRVGR